MRNSRGGLRDIPSRGRAGEKPASARPRQGRGREQVSSPKNRPFRRREIGVYPNPTCGDLTPKRKRQDDFAVGEAATLGTGAHSREQRPAVSADRSQRDPQNVPFVTRARNGRAKNPIIFQSR